MKRRLPQHWDVFICHAKEDKAEVARPLANALKSRGLDVWYDEFSLKLGDSLRRTIDRGLAKSKYGVVILSQNFFDKEWPQKELDALVEREVQSRRKIVLPIWHKVDVKTVAKFSPLLADKVAASTSERIDVVADKILGIIQRRKAVEPLDNRTETFVDSNFKIAFSSKLTNLTELLERKEYDPQQVNNLVDVLIMLFKERIEKWDVPSVKFATKELFTKLYKFSEENGFCELYTIFKDLFGYAYSQRKYLLGSMIEIFNLILFGSWVHNYDIEKGEKAAKVMLRLGIDFFDEDLAVTNNCFVAIDNLAGDMFEPEILSKEILLGANAFQKMSKNSGLKDFVEQLVDWIRINDQYAWDAGIKTYLRDSILHAEWEQEKYEINIEVFKRKYLLPALRQNIDEKIKDYIQFLGDQESEREDITFPAEELASMILAYEFLHPKIADEIRERVIETKNSYIMKLFKRIVNSNNFLMKIYRGLKMITTFDELIRFFEANSDMGNFGVGVTTYNFAMIDFRRKLKEEEKEAFKKIARKYGVQEEFEVTDEGISFEMDHLVYLGHNQNNMRRLIDFLNEINSVFAIDSFSTGITFKLRETEKKPKR